MMRLPRLESPCRVTLGRPDRTRQLAVDIDFERLLGGRARELGIGRMHAAIEGDAQGLWWIIHLGARNPIVVNGGVRLRRLGDREPLKNGARIHLGTLELLFRVL